MKSLKMPFFYFQLLIIASTSLALAGEPREKGNQNEPKKNKQQNIKTSEPTTEDLLSLAKKQKDLKNYEDASNTYKQLADKGNAEAQFRLGEILTEGWGGLKDADAGKLLISMAAEKNYPYALHYILVDKSPETLIAKLNPLAESGNADAQVILADIYIRGNLANVNLVYKWINRVISSQYCNDDIASSLELMAVDFGSGLGVQKDYDIAMKLLTKSAKCGSASATTMIGKMYFTGAGVAKDQDEAFKWFSKAIILGGEKEEKAIEQFLKSRRMFDRYISERERLPKASRYGWRVGMSKEQVLSASAERPIRKNKFTSPTGTQEQWVYGNTGWAYLFFDQNGNLSSYQERETQ